ncbi:TonB-dependent receptor, partial [Pseudomonas aeruginosa]
RPWGQPNNIDEARIRGVELVLGSQWLGWDWNANATFLDPQNRSGGVNDGNELPRRARRMFNLELDRRFERLSLGASVHAEGRRYDDPANKVRLGGYATLDLRSEYRLNDEWRLQGRIANLFGADYETAYGYNQPGQAVYLSVRYQAL